MSHSAGHKTESLINEIIERYKQSNELEFELRLKSVSKETFLTALHALAKSDYTFDAIEQTVNTIFNLNDSNEKGPSPAHIRRITFDLAGNKVSDTHSIKQQVMRNVYITDYLNYTINLNLERSDKFVPTKQDAEVRIKYRISFISPCKQWRIDLTAVKAEELNIIGSSLSTIVKSMFRHIDKRSMTDAELYEAKLDYAYVNKFEIECEHIGDKTKLSPASVRQVVKSLFSYISPTYTTDNSIKETVVEVAKDILNGDDRLHNFVSGTWGMKRLLNNALSITYNDYAEIYESIDGKLLTEKANGLRCVIRISGNTCKICTDKLIELTYSGPPLSTTIVDAELIPLASTDITYTACQILAFDIMMHNGKKVTSLPITQRLQLLPDAVQIIEKFCGTDLSLDCKIIAKKFTVLSRSKLKEQFESVYNAKYPYDIDGLMIVNPLDDYFETKWYKWKPLENNTIDFLAVKLGSNLLGIAPYIKKPGYDLYALFVGIDPIIQRELGLDVMPKYNTLFTLSHRGYIPIQFSPSTNPGDYLYWHKSDAPSIHMLVVEMRKTHGNITDDWEIVKIRHDRKIDENYYGNDFKTAELTYQNYINKLTFESLYNFDNESYFTKTADAEYKAKNGFNRFVVSNVISIYTKGREVKYAIDLASGRGADINRYRQCKVHETLFIDVDVHALTELVQRKFSSIVRQRHQRDVRSEAHGTTIHVLSMDLKTPYEQMISAVSKFRAYENTVDLINCSFAFHYFCDTVEHLRNIIKFIAQLLKLGAVFTFTVLNGEKVFGVLGSNTEYNFGEIDGSANKYVIKRMYNGTKLAEVGQTIGIKLPFTDKIYEEPLCNINYVIKEFKAHGFVLDANNSFDVYLSDFQSENRPMYNQLSAIDIAYISMHSVVAVRKVK